MRKSWFQSRENLIVSTFLLCEFVGRAAWLAIRPSEHPVNNEAHNVAVSLVTTGRFADPFLQPSGYTAHLGMLTPIPSAIAYWAFGVDTPLSEFALSLWTTGLVVIGAWLCWRMAKIIGTPPLARMVALACACLLPLQFDARNWEVVLAATMLLWVLLRIVRSDQSNNPAPYSLAVTGSITGILFILSPPAGLAAVFSIGLFQLRALPVPKWWIAPLAFLLVAGTLAGGWAIRNNIRLGEPIALRDNLGLELDLANYDGAISPRDPHAEFLARMIQIHPMLAGTGVITTAGGEAVYYEQRGREARAWIARHPREFLGLCARRFIDFYFPPTWVRNATGIISGKAIWFMQFVTWMSAIAGISTLAIMTYSNRKYGYLLVATLACSLPYIFTQPNLRYRYLIFTLLVFAAFDGTERLALLSRAYWRRQVLAKSK